MKCNGVYPLLGGENQTVNTDEEKAEVLNKYFCSAFGKKKDNVFVLYEDDEILFIFIKEIY